MAYNHQMTQQFQQQHNAQQGWMNRLQPRPETMQRTINNLNQHFNDFQRRAIRESAQQNEQLHILQQRINELETTNRQLQGQLQQHTSQNKPRNKLTRGTKGTTKKAGFSRFNQQDKHRNPKLLMRSNPKKAIQRAIEGNHILKMVVVFPYDDPTANYKKAIQIAAEKSNYFQAPPTSRTSQ